ncbi:MAG: CRISPR-associated endonuclease Cas2 [Nitrospirae bacterium]|nr:MAG: CRISPR-associated endonuclease Cas2 [Nitrospirota bacterium]
MLTWVVYDVAATSMRTKIAKACKEAGLYRVQKSVFLGTLERNQVEELAVRCEELMNREKDSLYIFPMCDEDFKKVKLLGQAFDKALVTDEILAKFF